jgi:hypothetical protein
MTPRKRTKQTATPTPTTAEQKILDAQRKRTSRVLLKRRRAKSGQ